MLNRSLASILIVTSSFILSIGQTPEADKGFDKGPRTFAFAFEGGGSFLGVQTKEVNKDNFAKFGLKDVRGVAIEKVMENSPAAAAGLLAGDVIIKFNGEEVTGGRKLTRLVGEVDPDHQAKITVVRGGREQELTATIAKRSGHGSENGNFEFKMPAGIDLQKLTDMPEFDSDMPQVFSVPGGAGQGKNFSWSTGEGRQIGIGVTSMSKQLGQNFGVDGGALVNTVKDNSPAAKAGIKAGDVIVDVDGVAIRGHMDLVRTINQKKEGDVTLTIVRDRNRQTITLTPEKATGSGFVFDTEGDDDGIRVPPIPAPGAFRFSYPPTPAAPAPMPLFHPNPVI